MIHRANADFWKDYHALPAEIRARADKQFALLKDNPHHPSLQFKKLGERNQQEIWSARVTLKYRAVAVRIADEYIWFWIGDHNVYDALVG
jgi:mRNA-degrading endonuclease RelE of RelBE toxin-antitoxin system